MAKTKQAPHQPTEQDINKALDELQELAKGGDPLIAADPEGGLNVPGTSLTSKIGGAAKVAKADDSYSDDSSDSDDESSDDGSSYDAANKSLRERAEADKVMRKGIRANEFLDAFTAGISDTIDDYKRGTEEKLDAHAAKQQSFNVRVAKAFNQLGTLLTQQSALIKGLQQEVAKSRGVVAKALNVPVETGRPYRQQDGEVIEPNVQDDLTKSDFPLDNVDNELIKSWLEEQAMSDDPQVKVTFEDITVFEHNRYNPRALKPRIQKALVQEFCA